METVKSFKDLKVWQKARTLFTMAYADVGAWPRERGRQVLSYQLLRSAGSIGANISEGYGRGSPGEFEQFLRYARGSAAETDNWLCFACEAGLISKERYEEYSGLVLDINKMSGAFIAKLRLQEKRHAPHH
jgi:four helix bundle protein